MNRVINCIDAGFVPYARALRWQRSLRFKRQKREIGDSLLLLEHPPVYTFGRRDSSEDLLVSRDWLHRNGMEIHKTDRGGRITYHGPGQLVVYLIFEVKNSIPQLVWQIEETLIHLLWHYHLEGQRNQDRPGVWVEERKIAALGLHLQRGITTHGFSLNVNCDMKPFRYIVPCGIRDREMTSLERELGWQPSMRDVKHLLLEKLCAVFQRPVSAGGSSATQPE